VLAGLWGIIFLIASPIAGVGFGLLTGKTSMTIENILFTAFMCGIAVFEVLFMALVSIKCPHCSISV
jgi:uncharacterized membrane protein YtjA (UPF0391 family)